MDAGTGVAKLRLATVEEKLSSPVSSVAWGGLVIFGCVGKIVGVHVGGNSTAARVGSTCRGAGSRGGVVMLPEHAAKLKAIKIRSPRTLVDIASPLPSELVDYKRSQFSSS